VLIFVIVLKMLKIEEDMSIKTVLKNLNTKGSSGIKGGFEIRWN